MIFFKDIRNYLFGILATLIFSATILVIPNFLKENFGMEYEDSINLWLFTYFILPNIVLIIWMCYRPPSERGIHIDLGKLSNEEKKNIKDTTKKTERYEKQRVVILKIIAGLIILYSTLSLFSLTKTANFYFYSQLIVGCIVLATLLFYAWFITQHLFIYYESEGHFYKLVKKLKPKIVTVNILNPKTKYFFRKTLWEFFFTYFLFFIITFFFLNKNYSNFKVDIEKTNLKQQAINYISEKDSLNELKNNLNNELQLLSKKEEDLNKNNEENQAKLKSIGKDINEKKELLKRVETIINNGNTNLSTLFSFYQLRGLMALLVLLSVILTFWYHINLENLIKKDLHDKQQSDKSKAEKEDYEDIADVEYSKTFLLYIILLIFPLFRQIDEKDIKDLSNPFSIFSPVKSISNLFTDFITNGGNNGNDGKNGEVVITEVIVDTTKIAEVKKRIDMMKEKIDSVQSESKRLNSSIKGINEKIEKDSTDLNSTIEIVEKLLANKPNDIDISNLKDKRGIK